MTPYREHTERVCAEPDLRIEITRVGDVAVCSLAGDLHLDNEQHIHDALARTLDRTPALLVVEMSAVTLFTSSALNALLTARRRALADGVPLLLAAPSPVVRRVLRITGSDPAFPLCPSPEKAVHHQRSSPAV